MINPYFKDKRLSFSAERQKIVPLNYKVKAMFKDQFLTIKEVCRIVPYSRPHIYRLVNEGKFPKQIKLGSGQTGRAVWLEKEIVEWLKVKIEKRR